MTARTLILAAGICGFLTLGAATAAPGPAMAVDKAATLAQEHLKERGLDQRIFVSSLVLESTALARGEKFWYARWSESVPHEERRKEVGVRINMDGSLVRVVESPAKEYKDHRTRSSRPSILDLKH